MVAVPRFAEARALTLRLSQRGGHHDDSDTMFLLWRSSHDGDQEWQPDCGCLDGRYDAFYVEEEYDDRAYCDEDRSLYGLEKPCLGKQRG